MLSILIPIYNYSVISLITELRRQALSLSIDFEIITAEDGSTKFLAENNQVKNLDGVKYIVLPQNIGRASIRNYLSDKAKYNYLLFLDCDSIICISDFIKKYLENCKENCVVLGGRVYAENIDKQYSLLAKYGKKNEQNISENIKKHSAHKTFTSPNFLIDKSTFNKVRFDENFKEYGHEDTIFGFDLLRQGYEFSFIDNPILHEGLDNNTKFIEKTELSLNTLLKLYKSKKYPELNINSKILKIFSRIEKFHLVSTIAFLHKISKKLFYKNLTGKNPSLFLFDLYKLGTICRISNNANAKHS